MQINEQMDELKTTRVLGNKSSHFRCDWEK